MTTLRIWRYGSRCWASAVTVIARAASLRHRSIVGSKPPCAPLFSYLQQVRNGQEPGWAATVVCYTVVCPRLWASREGPGKSAQRHGVLARLIKPNKQCFQLHRAIIGAVVGTERRQTTFTGIPTHTPGACWPITNSSRARDTTRFTGPVNL